MFRAFALTAAAAAIAMAAFARPPEPSPDTVEAGIAEAANGFRADNHLGVLSRNGVLADEARRFAAYLASTGRFSHTADGREPGERAKAAGYDYCVLAENIALEEDTSGFEAGRLTRLFMAGWEASPGHRRNLLDPSVTETGVGVARAPGGGHKYLAVQVFGLPISARRRFKVQNQSDRAIGYDFDGRRFAVPAHATLMEETCASGELVFDRDIKADEERFRVTPGATYVVSPARFGVHIEVRREIRRTGGPDED